MNNIINFFLKSNILKSFQINTRIILQIKFTYEQLHIITNIFLLFFN